MVDVRDLPVGARVWSVVWECAGSVVMVLPVTRLVQVRLDTGRSHWMHVSKIELRAE